MKDVWTAAFVDPLKEFLLELGAFLPHLLAMIVILALGLIFAWALKTVTARLLAAVHFDQICSRLGLAQILTKGGGRETPSDLIARILYWAVAVLFLILGLGALNLRPVDQFVTQALSYIPHLLVSIVILIVGFLLANFFGRAALIAAVNAQIAQARLLARAVRLAVILFALAMALEQLGIAKSIIVAAFSITFGGVVLALAIAFGLGAKDAARSLIERNIKKDSERKDEEFSHL